MALEAIWLLSAECIAVVALATYVETARKTILLLGCAKN